MRGVTHLKHSQGLSHERWFRRLGRRDLVVATGRAYIPVLLGRRGRVVRMISLATARLVLRRWIGRGLVRDEQQTKAASRPSSAGGTSTASGRSPWRCAPLAS